MRVRSRALRVAPRTAAELKAVKAELRQKAVEAVERSFVLEALERNGWNVSAAARDVDMLRQNFQAVMRRHGIRLPETEG